MRSPHPHAAIRKIDARDARALPGVHAVLTLADLEPVMAQRRMLRHSNSGAPLERFWSFALADGETSYVGEAVALVVADDRYIAEDAVALVAVDYEVLPAVADCRKAVAPDAPAVRRELNSNTVAAYQVAYGDVDAAFQKAAHVLHDELWQHRGAAHPIEGRGLLAEWRDEAMTVWASTQKAHDLFQTLTVLLDLDESRLRVATPEVGGGFGPKLCVYSEDIAVAAAAKLIAPLDQMDRGPARAFHQCRPGARPILVARPRGRCRRPAARNSRAADPRARRLRAAGRQYPLQLRLHVERALSAARRWPWK